jgi:hypothetical protein
MVLEHSPRPPAYPTAQPAKRPARVWRTTARRGIGAGLVALMLWGCGSAPFVDSRREAGQTVPVGASTPDRVAICYSSRGAAPRDVIALAQAECAKTARTAQFDGQDEFRCALLTPTRAFFKCVGR